MMIRHAASLLLLTCTAAAQQPVDSQLDAIFGPLANAKSPGLAVLVRKDGRTVFERGYGVRDLRSLRKIDAVTDFRLASFTKQFTAMAVMLLVRDGKLRYDQPLTGIFPGFPPYARAITVRHLLTHTSGLPDYEDAMDAHQWTPEHQIQDEDVLALLQRQSQAAVRRGNELGVQQFRLRALGPDRRESKRRALWTVSRRPHLQAPADERYAGLPQRQEQRAESRIRAFGEGR